ncbi:MAG: hypothetical protein ACLQVD_07895 [Capsulimonadaceae bacterium]
MAGTMVCVFDIHRTAERAASALHTAGVPFADISLVRKGAGGAAGNLDCDLDRPDREEEEYTSHSFREVDRHDIEDLGGQLANLAPATVAGIVAGVPLGTLLVATAVAVPGIGPLIIDGAAAAMLTGAMAGGIIGGLVGALASVGVPMEHARFYHEHVAVGHTLIAVLAGHLMTGKIEKILLSHGGHDIRYFTRLIDSLQSFES